MANTIRYDSAGAIANAHDDGCRAPADIIQLT